MYESYSLSYIKAAKPPLREPRPIEGEVDRVSETERGCEENGSSYDKRF